MTVTSMYTITTRVPYVCSSFKSPHSACSAREPAPSPVDKIPFSRFFPEQSPQTGPPEAPRNRPGRFIGVCVHAHSLLHFIRSWRWLVTVVMSGAEAEWWWWWWSGVRPWALYCGNSLTGRLCLRVSMRDCTPLLTLVETRRDTESPGGEEPQAFWEGGRATRHFW